MEDEEFILPGHLQQPRELLEIELRGLCLHLNMMSKWALHHIPLELTVPGRFADDSYSSCTKYTGCLFKLGSLNLDEFEDYTV